MPLVRNRNSTSRRSELASFVETFGDDMVQKCSTCAKHNRVCRVHLRSGKCSACLHRNQRCDVRVTQSEFRRLTEEKHKLKRKIDEALASQAKALEELQTARAREERLRQQMGLLDHRAAEAIAVESRALDELEAEEEQALETLPEIPSDPNDFFLSPTTWGALDDLPVDFWEVPVVPSSVDTGQ